VNILPMLARLEHAIGCTDLAKQIVLISNDNASNKRSKEINLVVGYNGSPRSQSALDLTLWIAHQTRLATGCPVTVQVVYVVNLNGACGLAQGTFSSQIAPSPRKRLKEIASGRSPVSEPGVATVERSPLEESFKMSRGCQDDLFEQADQILWQARHMAEEWRGSLKTHLRFGQVTFELCQVVEAESASILVVGCTSKDHPLVQQLQQTSLPCPVLGIPVLS